MRTADKQWQPMEFAVTVGFGCRDAERAILRLPDPPAQETTT